MKYAARVLVVVACAASPVAAQRQADSIAVYKFKEEGLRRSQVMDVAHWLTDVYGPRLTGSWLDSLAGEYAMRKMREWGLSNVHPEPFAFHLPSWQNDRFYMQVTSPSPFPVLAMIGAWSVGTDSLVKAPVAIARIRSSADTAALSGKLRGKVVLISALMEGLQQPSNIQLTKAQLDEMARTGKHVLITQSELLVQPTRRRVEPPVTGTPIARAALENFFAKEGVVAVLRNLEGAAGGNFEVYDSWLNLPVPQVNVAPEHYGRMYRTLEAGTPVQIEFDIRNRISPTVAKPFNVLGEIPGTDKKSEVVLIGAHLDSWIGATGATDNGAGVAVMMEAMRILKTSGVRLRRTVRIALWNGEEQFGLGSQAYIEEHLASMKLVNNKWIVTPKGDNANFSAYFNLDAGTGLIRGLDTYENDAAKPIFENWIRRLLPDSLGISHVFSIGNDSSDDGEFNSAGLPAFYFNQDPVDYERGTHHTSQDLYEHFIPANPKQNAVIVAAIVYLAANHDSLLPRKPVP